MSRAQSSTPDAALAETLFQEGRRLMLSGNYAEACPKFAESQRLDARSGTLLNLAACHEREGKIATAWAEFNDAVSLAQRDVRPDREKYARDRIQALEPRLSRLKIVVSPEAEREPELRISVDGLVVGKAAWGMPVPLDPGPHEVTAEAKGSSRWSSRIVLREAESIQVEIPKLPEAEAAAVQMTATPGAVTSDTQSSTSPRTPYIYALAGVGVAALAVGTFYGVRAIGKRSDAEEHCDQGRCTARAVELNEDAQTAAWISNIGIGAGLVSLGVAGYLLISDRHVKAESAKTKSVRALPLASEHSIGAFVEGRF